MAANSFGHAFRITTFGESHSTGVGVIIDGCPAGLPLTEADIQAQLSRRRPGQSKLCTPRNENDEVRILSGVEFGRTLGTPISLIVENKNQQPNDYKSFAAAPRPSHADYTYLKKFGTAASSGGGRASARETIGRVAAGAVAEKILSHFFNIEIVAWVSQVHQSAMSWDDVNLATISREQVDTLPVRCPHEEYAQRMTSEIKEAIKRQDSVGGTISCVCRNVPAGLGEPVFEKCEALLAQAMLSLPAVKGFEIGSGFSCVNYFGSEHNDMFYKKEDGSLGTITNRSGGIQGGITNGEPIYFRVAFKPTSTIGKPQASVDYDGNPCDVIGRGRHDPCVLPRAVPIVEGMTAIVLADLLLRSMGGRQV